jgi:hypothetical protein
MGFAKPRSSPCDFFYGVGSKKKSTGKTRDEREQQFEVPLALFLLTSEGKALSPDQGYRIVCRIMGHILESDPKC